MTLGSEGYQSSTEAMGRRFLVFWCGLVAFLLFVAPSVHAGNLSIAWDAPTTNMDGTPLTDLKGYRVYYGDSSTAQGIPPCNKNSIDVGNVTTFVVMGLTDGANYAVQVTALDTEGNESFCSNLLVAIDEPDPSSTMSTSISSPSDPSAAAPNSSGGGGRCFIATAAYGSPLEPQVVLLRAFRDEYLVTTRPGKAFVEWYYRTSPPLADRIRQAPLLRALVRGILWPLVGIVWLILHPVIGVGLLVGGGGALGWLRFRRTAGSWRLAAGRDLRTTSSGQQAVPLRD